MDDDSFEVEEPGSLGLWRRNVLPFVALIVVVGVIGGAILGGVVGNGGRHIEPPAPTTTVPTVHIEL